MFGVKDKVKFFEEINSINKVSHGTIPKDKTSCVNEEKREVNPPSLEQTARNVVVMTKSEPEVPKRYLSESGGNRENKHDFNLEETCKIIFKTITLGVNDEPSAEDLLYDLWIIEKLRDAFEEKVKEAQVNCFKFNGEHEEKVYENVMGMFAESGITNNNIDFSFVKSRQDLNDFVMKLEVIENLRDTYLKKVEERYGDDEFGFNRLREVAVEACNGQVYINDKEEVNSMSAEEDQWISSHDDSWDNDEYEEVASEKMQHLIQELIDTEEKYISDLEKIVKHYIPYFNSIELPRNLAGKQANLFGNIAEIYNESKYFLAALKPCGYNHEKVAESFLTFEIMFQLYPLYSKNKPNADTYLVEFQTYARCKQRELGDRLDLRSYLLAPIQRLGKYILFLQGIDKELKKINSQSIKVQNAIDLVKEVMSKADDYVAIGSIRHCPINLNKAGALVMRTRFYMRTNLIEQYFESMVYFFEEVLIFTIENKKRKEAFAYFTNVQMTDLLLPPVPQNQPFILNLEDYSKSKRSNTEHCIFTLIASSITMKQFWKKHLEERLWQQASKCKDEVNAQYNDSSMLERAKTLPVGKRGRKRFVLNRRGSKFNNN